MKQILHNIIRILSHKERTGLTRLIFMDIAVSILDISFLAALLYVVHFYTGNRPLVNAGFPFALLNQYPLLLILLFLVLFGIKNFFGFWVFRKQCSFVYNVASRLSKNNLQYYLDGSYNEYVDIDSSVHTRRVSHQPIEFSHYVLNGLQQVIGQLILIILTIITILVFNPLLFLLLLIILTPPIILAGILMKKKLNTIRKTARPVSEKTVQHLQEALASYIESNVYERKSFFTSRYYFYQSAFNRFLAAQQAMQNMPSRLIEVFAVFGLFVLLVINTYTSKTGIISVVTIGAFMAAAYKIIPGIVKILNSLGQIRTYSFTINDLLLVQTKLRSGVYRTNATISNVKFTNVSLRYKDQQVLNDFSMTISKGDFIGLSGRSGKGKTSIMNLLLGFLQPYSGTIEMNGVVTEATDRQNYWRAVAYVKQQSLLINDSVLNNITLDDENSDIPKAIAVAEITGLQDLFSKSPGGLQKQITESGKNISGGERQRIALARALYKEAELLILDEPFNELDRGSENKLLEHFKSLAATGKIVILVTHNRESLSYCNKIVSLDEK